MSRTFLVASLLALVVTGAIAKAQDSGDCTLRNLAACQNSNDLFWGAADKSGRTTAKREFRDSLAAFLRNAPRLYLGKSGFSVAQIASGALVGPGDHHDRISGGWFFDGFTPHDAQERGAVLFDAAGAIKLVALLNVETDEAGPEPAAEDMNHYRLRVYGHGKADAANIHLLQNWAGYAIKTDNRRNGQTLESLIGTELVTLESNQWRRTP